MHSLGKELNQMENHHLKVELTVEQADKFDKATEFVIHDNAFA